MYDASSSPLHRYSPEALRARLAQLHTDVWSRLDDDSVGALACQLRTCNRRMAGTDLLDLDARALAAKAHKLRMLAPHIAPSMLFRAVPELADVEPEEVPRLVQGVGKVVAVLHPSVAKRIAFRVQADNTITVVALQPRASVAAAAQQLPMALFATTAEPQALATAGSSNGALSWHSYGASSHNAGCGTSSTATLLPLVPTMTLRAAAMGRGTSCDDGWMYESDDSTREQPGCVIATLSNVISVVYVGPLLELDVRHTQPDATSACSTTTAESASVVAASAAYSKKQQEVIHSRQASSSRHVHHDNINHDATESVQSVYSTYPMAAMA